MIQSSMISCTLPSRSLHIWVVAISTSEVISRAIFGARSHFEAVIFFSTAICLWRDNIQIHGTSESNNRKFELLNWSDFQLHYDGFMPNKYERNISIGFHDMIQVWESEFEIKHRVFENCPGISQADFSLAF